MRVFQEWFSARLKQCENDKDLKNHFIRQYPSYEYAWRACEAHYKDVIMQKTSILNHKDEDNSSIYFSNEMELMQHLIDGGVIRPRFRGDETNKNHWIRMENGNRIYIKSGKPANNCLMSHDYWVKAIQ
jgi:hypothetical protein